MTLHPPQHPWIMPFLEARAAEAGAAKNTLLSYQRDLNDFADWSRRKGKDLPLVDQAQIEAYLVSCTDEGLSPATRARRLSSIRQLFAFAFEEGLRQDNPALEDIR